MDETQNYIMHSGMRRTELSTQDYATMWITIQPGLVDEPVKLKDGEIRILI